MIHLKVEGLVKRLGGVAAVDDASFEALPGDLTVVLGPAGSGKTTIARLLAGLEAPDQGEIEFDGRMVTHLPPGRRNVGYLPREPSLWPHLSVAENVAFGLRARGIERRERARRVADALSKMGVEGLADRRPHELTALQSRRAELARAVALEPDLLLIDEPFGPLDPRARREIRDDLRRLLLEGGATLLVFTSEAREALALADRLTVLDLGRVVQADSPRAVYQRPANLFVAQFLGPTNLLNGQVEPGEGPSPATLLVRTPLGLLAASAGPGPTALAPGAPVTLSIRPESIRPTASPGPASNGLEVTLERLVYQGETTQLVLRGPGDWPLSALCLPFVSAGWREGQTLSVEIPPDEVVVLAGRYTSA